MMLTKNRISLQKTEWREEMSLSIFIQIYNVCMCFHESDAVLRSHGCPLPHGWFVQRGEGQLWEVQALRHQTLSSARHWTRQGLCSSPVPLSPSSSPLSLFFFFFFNVTPPSSRCESAWSSSVPLLGWSSLWICTPPNTSWRSTWRRFLTGLFLLSSYSQSNYVSVCYYKLLCEQCVSCWSHAIKWYLVPYRNDKLFHKNCINDWQYVRGSNKKHPKSEIKVTVITSFGDMYRDRKSVV